MFKVQKKDGQPEDFDRNKVLNGLIKSGVSSEEAEKITVQVEGWLPTIAVGGVIKTMDIRSKILELLRAVNPVAASSFENYQKPVAV